MEELNNLSLIKIKKKKKHQKTGPLLPGFVMTLSEGFEHDTPWENLRILSPTCCFPKGMTLNLKGIVIVPNLPGNVGWVKHLIRVAGLFLFVVRCCGYLAGCRAKKTKKCPQWMRGKAWELSSISIPAGSTDTGFYILTLFSQKITMGWQRVIRLRLTVREMGHINAGGS